MFLEQLAKVQKLRKRIDELSDNERKVSEMCKSVKKKEHHIEAHRKKKSIQLIEIDKAEQSLMERKKQLTAEGDDLKAKGISIDATCAVLEAQIKLQKNNIATSQEKIKTLQNIQLEWVKLHHGLVNQVAAYNLR